MNDLHDAMRALYAVEHFGSCDDRATLRVKVGRQSAAEISNSGGRISSVSADTVNMTANECVATLTERARDRAAARVAVLHRAIDAADALMGEQLR